MQDRESLYKNLVILAKGAQALGIPILWNEQVPEKLGPTIPELSEALPGLKPMAKSCFSCWKNPAFAEGLRRSGRRQLLLAGIEAHVCVYQTAMDLIREGYEVHVVADAISSRTASNRAIGLERMTEAGAALTSTEMALFELVQVAEGERFRQIARLVR